MGAAHQQPQGFQVVTDVTLRPITVGRTRIRFFLQWRLAETPATEVKTATGAMRVSTPEAAALDLVRYELSEEINPQQLVEAARPEVELSAVQRLAFLLEHFAASGVVAPLAKWLATKRPRPVSLRPERKPKVTEKDSRWRVLVNERVEVDE